MEKGYDNATMEDVIENSGMSTGGVYHYYKSVYDIFYDIMFEGLKYGEHRSLESNCINIDCYIDFMIEKILDDNSYKSLFAILLKGISSNKDLKKMYLELESEYFKMLKRIFNNGEISTEVLEDKFLENFVHSLIIGYESFEVLGAKELFKENRDILRRMIVLYLKEKMEGL